MRDDLCETLRSAVKQCEVSYMQLALKTGVPQSSISRFVAGGDIYLSSAAKLAHHLGLRLLPKDSKKKNP